MRKCLILLVVLALLAGTALATEDGMDFTGMTAETVIRNFIAENGYDEKNFAISYYNTVTGESYAWNDTWFSIAASTYKLPLNM